MNGGLWHIWTNLCICRRLRVLRLQYDRSTRKRYVRTIRYLQWSLEFVKLEGQRRAWDGSLNPAGACDPGALDLSMYAQYPPPTEPPTDPTTGVPSGLPQESKLATYMNRTTSTPSSLNQQMSQLNLESSPQSVNKVMVNEFIPMSYYQPNMMPEAPENSHALAMAAHMPMPITTQVHQENVGGTTYFYSTNTDNLNASALNASASMGSDVCLAGAVGPVPASPYATQMYAANPHHLAPPHPINIKPVATWQALPLPNLVPIPVGYPQAAPCPYNDYRCTGFMSPHYGLQPRYSSMYSPRSDIPIQAIDSNPTPDFTESLAASFYTEETIKEETYRRIGDYKLKTDTRQFPDLPLNVEMYTALTPLENNVPHSLTTSFRVTHRRSGEFFALRRFHSYPTVPSNRLELWKQIDHPNVVKLHEFFTTSAFGDHSLVLVYTYHPFAETLVDKYLSGGAASAADRNAFMDPFSSDPDAPRPYTHQKNAMLRAVACGALLPEAVLWSLLLQLSAGLRALHNAGLACRVLDLTKVVMNGPRARISWGGACDSEPSSLNDLHQAQQDDLTALGRLTLALACRTVHCENLAACVDLVARTYSSDFKHIVVYLLSNTRKSLAELMPMIGSRYYTQIEALQRRSDAFEKLLAKELDNGRLLRILVKLGVINERPELIMDETWAETGDRYLLKLFRDRLFHGVTAEGLPWMDLGHLIFNLNNLDSGSLEPVELCSRDGGSVLIVTYGEIKHCLETAFDEVMSRASRP